MRPPFGIEIFAVSNAVALEVDEARNARNDFDNFILDNRASPALCRRATLPVRRRVCTTTGQAARTATGRIRPALYRTPDRGHLRARGRYPLPLPATRKQTDRLRVSGQDRVPHHLAEPRPRMAARLQVAGHPPARDRTLQRLETQMTRNRC